MVPDPPLGEADDFGQKNMGRQDWTLMIKFVTARDSGAYECQVISSAFILILLTRDKQACYMMHTDLGGHEIFILGFGSKIFSQINIGHMFSMAVSI